MKLLLLHGPAITSSRAYLTNFKKKFGLNNVVVFEEGSDTKTFMGSLMTPILLAEEQLIILENPPEDFTIDSSLTTFHLSLIFWFDHEVSDTKPIMEWVRKSKGEIFYFSEAKEVSVFPFLDYLIAGDKKAFLEIDRLKKGGFDVFYFITMVFYLLRSLTVTPKNAPQFVRQKLIKQRKRFNLADIKTLYKEILAIEFRIKSGVLHKEQAEFLMVNKFITK